MGDHQAMLDNEAMRKAIRAAIDGSGRTHAYIADELGVTVQAVTGWLRTGRIDKRRLPALARVTRVPLSKFMPGATGESGRRLKSEDPPPYGGRALDPPDEPSAELWKSFSRAPAAVQDAVTLLLMDPDSRAAAMKGRPALTAAVELLEMHASEALSARKSA